MQYFVATADGSRLGLDELFERMERNGAKESNTRRLPRNRSRIRAQRACGTLRIGLQGETVAPPNPSFL